MLFCCCEIVNFLEGELKFYNLVRFVFDVVFNWSRKEVSVGVMVDRGLCVIFVKGINVIYIYLYFIGVIRGGVINMYMDIGDF